MWKIKGAPPAKLYSTWKPISGVNIFLNPFFIYIYYLLHQYTYKVSFIFTHSSDFQPSNKYFSQLVEFISPFFYSIFFYVIKEIRNFQLFLNCYFFIVYLENQRIPGFLNFIKVNLLWFLIE